MSPPACDTSSNNERVGHAWKLSPSNFFISSIVYSRKNNIFKFHSSIWRVGKVTGEARNISRQINHPSTMSVTAALSHSILLRTVCELIEPPSYTDLDRVNSEFLQSGATTLWMLLGSAPFKVSHPVCRHILRNSRNRSPTMSSSSASSSSKNDAESLRRSRILSSKLYLDVPTSKVNLSTNLS